MIHSESNPPVSNTPWYPKYKSPKAHGMNHPLFIPVGQSPQSPKTGAVPGRVVPWPSSKAILIGSPLCQDLMYGI